MNVIVEREKGLLELEARIGELRSVAAAQSVDLSTEIGVLEAKAAQIAQEMFGSMTPWQRVNMARHPRRPLGSDYLEALDSFDELHGDRHSGDDSALIGGCAKFGSHKVVVLAQLKGRDTKQNIQRNFGMPSPHGYRKAKRLMELASRLGLPIVTFIDTPGADPGIASEEHNQSEAIAACLTTLAGVEVPVVATVIGEGGSGGALALGVADHVIMLEHSIYSVASPEGCAAILWGDASKADEAAARLRLTSEDLKNFGIIDEIVAEPLGGAHRDGAVVVRSVFEAIGRALDRLSATAPNRLIDLRYKKYRSMGVFTDTTLNRAGLAA
jgi:acetyl-CoA carboxylase carboxyl transferase subunit alpha